MHTCLLLGVFSWYRLIQPEVAHTYQVGDMKADIKETYRLPADDEPDLSIGFSGEAALRGPYSGQLVMSRSTVRVHVSVLPIRRR